MKRRSFLSLMLATPLLGAGLSGGAAQERQPLVLMGTEAPEVMRGLVEALGQSAESGGLAVDYRQARPAQIVSRLSSQADAAALPHLVLLPTPDLAVYLANEGHTLPQALPAGLQAPHWRHEVFVVGHDAAVFVTHKRRVADEEGPRSRIELARMLERHRSRFQGRVGLVNIGIDNVAYGYAAQDSLRSALFWRISGAFGASRARIFDTPEELLAALSEGIIDFGYNVPLSAARRAASNDPEIQIIIPQDYVLALPWTVLVPARAGRQDGMLLPSELVGLFFLPPVRQALSGMGLIPIGAGSGMENMQMIELGPELLVFLDPLKRSRFLDTWFQQVVQN
ncbi:ABC transporter substrate-binding protein [Devosia sp. YIM 151766]|uniref:ABC transporter substrate-binding protein n=1 Tax=Devosia sp. YIM 151766 TaxID=3017325 RepID=UPI00255C9A75|nr:ABC transporter substrate-binding protein [Devosia sp. YIM 151766]WIY52042.1 ABC transporter substrate-binding protein [Devosia sp. YIM 151766]